MLRVAHDPGGAYSAGNVGKRFATRQDLSRPEVLLEAAEDCRTWTLLKASVCSRAALRRSPRSISASKMSRRPCADRRRVENSHLPASAPSRLSAPRGLFP